MKKVEKPLINTLLQDPSFINWVNETNKNDEFFWDNWIVNHPDHIDTIYTARAMLLGISFNKTTVGDQKVQKALDNVLKRIDNNTSTTTEPKRKRRSWLIYSAAAVVAICSVLGGLFVFSSKQVIHKTAFGEVIDLKLPDGTNLILNGNSEVTYNKENPRKVFLKGNAYFKVTSKPETNAKFWVVTDDLTVEVYGTQFNVNTRDEKTAVVLDEGSIQLILNNGVSKKMNPGEFLSYSNRDQNITHNKLDKSSSYATWRSGSYSFNNITLKELMNYISYTYGVATEFDKIELENISISGGIPTENLEICIKTIEKSSGVKIIRENDKLLIYN